MGRLNYSCSNRPCCLPGKNCLEVERNSGKRDKTEIATSRRRKAKIVDRAKFISNDIPRSASKSAARAASRLNTPVQANNRVIKV